MDIRISIESLKVTELSTSSGIFSGENYHAQWSAFSKQNTGLDLEGDSSQCTGCVNIVCDPDWAGMLKTRRGSRAGKERGPAE